MKDKMYVREWTAPISTVSEANTFENRFVKSKRHKNQKNNVKLFLNELSIYKNVPIIIRCIRIAPRKLDEHDNLPMAFKYIVDAIADIINPGLKAGRADDSKLISWEYAQEKRPGKKWIRIELWQQLD